MDDDRYAASSTQYYSVSQYRLPVAMTGDETIPTINLRRTEHEVDKETMHDVLTAFAHAVGNAAAETSNRPKDKERESHFDLQIAKLESAMDFATRCRMRRG